MSIKAAMDGFISDMKLLSFGSQTNERSPNSSKQSDENDTMKTKFLEAWNNFKFDMSSGTSVKKDLPLWLLGNCYHFHLPIENSAFDSPGQDDKFSKDYDHFQSFLKDFASKPWFTYRKGFPPLEDGGLTSDTGWGCMLRTAQMMMAQCFITHFLGRDWRWFSKERKTEERVLKECEIHRTIIKWFIDDPSSKCPFSIHRLTEIGLGYRFSPGDWYGPGTVAYIMQDATECAKGLNPLLDELVVYVAQDCTVYCKDVVEVCHWDKDHKYGTVPTTNNTANGHSSSLPVDIDITADDPPKRSVIILIPVRLGEACLNPIYSPCLKGMLALDQCMGIIGGKPKHSLYFVGFQDDYLFYLDPHYCQPADSAATFSNKQLGNYHSMQPRKTHVNKLDPSCCLCFYCRDQEDFQQFVSEANKLLAPPKQRNSYPLCLIENGSAQEHKMRRLSEARACTVLSKGRNTSFTELSLESEFDFDNPSVSTEPVSTVEEVATASCNAPQTKPDKKLNFVSTSRAMINKLYRPSPKANSSGEKSLEDEFEFI
uniref:Cysteine protease n=1 Tax=Phallusia mammillata TaxID=59560 RepID=A0A6F9D6H7_9ASCI|nr:cysteine protease ATG4D [Phallusia mammillata]